MTHAQASEPVGECCYGGVKPKSACASCAAWKPPPTQASEPALSTAGERAELIMALLEDAKHHEEIAGDCDCRPEDTVNWQHKLNCERAIALLQSTALPVGEPETFEAWNAKQHGDPEEIGFLQALRIAYCSGQDSVISIMKKAKGD